MAEENNNATDEAIGRTFFLTRLSFSSASTSNSLSALSGLASA